MSDADGDADVEVEVIAGAEYASFPVEAAQIYFESGFFNGADYNEIPFHGPDASIRGFTPKMDLRTLAVEALKLEQQEIEQRRKQGQATAPASAAKKKKEKGGNLR